MSKREWLAERMERSGATELLLRLARRRQPHRLSVLTFHRVHDPGADGSYEFDDGVVDATSKELDDELAVIARYCDPIGIADLVRYFAGGALPANPVLVTFDDGYRDNHDVALPLLRRHGVPAVFFIATRYVSERRLFWWDRIAYAVKHSPRERLAIAYPTPMIFTLQAPGDRAHATRVLLRLVKSWHGLELERFLTELAAAAGVSWDEDVERRHANEMLMTWDQVRALRAAGMGVQSHTRSHRVLDTLPPEQLEDELVGSRRELERELGEAVEAISYPVGHTLREHPALRRAVANAGYRFGFTNDTGTQPLARDVDPLDLRRVGRERGMSTALFRATLALPRLFD